MNRHVDSVGKMPKVGCIWVQKYVIAPWQVLIYTRAQATGFANGLQVDLVFCRGDDEAFDELFESARDPAFVEKAEVVYFSGHANRGGPVFGVTNRDDGVARSFLMKLGIGDLRVVVFDCCEALHLDVATCWCDALHGVRYLLGFDSLCRDECSRGAVFAAHLESGKSIREAWRCACIETEQEGRYWASVEVVGSDAKSDHGWSDLPLPCVVGGSRIVYRLGAT